MMITKMMMNEWLIVYCIWDGMEEEILGYMVGEQDMHEFIGVGQQYVQDHPVEGLGQ